MKYCVLRRTDRQTDGDKSALVELRFAAKNYKRWQINHRGFYSFKLYVVQGNFSVARHLIQVPPDGRLVGGDVLVGALVTGVLLAFTISTISTVLAVML